MDDPKVLIVEDSPEMADLLAISLQDGSIDTTVAGDGAEALGLIKDGGFDLVLLDLGLPDIDGMEVLERIRKEHDATALPVIIITGREKMSDKVRAFDLGAADYINKPINFLDVQARIVATLRRRRSHAEATLETSAAIQRTQEELRRIGKAVDSASDAICLLNSEQRVDYVNDAFVALFGVTLESLSVGGRFRRMFEPVSVWEEIWETCEEHGAFSGDLTLRGADESMIAVSCRADAILDEQRAFLGAVVLFTDIRQRKRLEEDLVFLAEHDALTGLMNRRRFLEVLAGAGAEGGGFLMYLDLDHFKVVNHRLNHRAGDRFLVQFAGLLEKFLRSGDEAARIGGDEFAALLRNITEEDALLSARKLAQELGETEFREDGESFSCSASIGLAKIDAAMGSEDVLANALAAGFQVKQAGGNGVEVSRADQRSLAQLTDDSAWFQRVKEALKHERLEVMYHPVLPLDESQPGGFEALVRLRDADGTLIGPDRFVPAAERFGILHRIDHAVLYTVVGHMRDHPELRASVNLSARTLTGERLPGVVTGLLEASRVDPRRIYFEITETTMIQNMEQARRNMRELQDFGCRFALDDFGKGVSSLGYLRDLPVDIIKIDGKFIQGIDTDEINQAMVRSINEIAHALGKKTVAEYVSTGPILAKVRELGIDYVQGWHICEPAPLESFLDPGLDKVKVPAA